MEKIFILGVCRTSIGKMEGCLSSVQMAELGAVTIKESVKRVELNAEDVDHVYMRCLIQTGLGQNVARQFSVKAEIFYALPAETLNVVYGSGLDAVNTAARLILSGDANIVVADDMESI